MIPQSDGAAARAPRFEAVANALAATRIGVWSWDLASGAVHWSPEVEAIFGLPSGGLARSFDAYLARVLPGDADQLRSVIDGTIARAETAPADRDAHTFCIEHRIAKPDDSVAWVEVRGHVELDRNHPRGAGLAGIVVDVTARKLAEAALREQAEEYRLFTELASDYVYSAEVMPDQSVRATIVAGSFERTTGHTFESLERGGGWVAMLHPEDRPAMLALAGRLLAGESLVNEYRIVDPAGDVRWLRDHVRPVKDAASGRVARVVGGVTDITQRKRLEAELLQARKLEAIGRLAGSVAHDFNNLLTVILNSAELLVRDHPELALNHDVGAIAESAVRGGDLTRSLLTIGRRQVDVARAVSVSEIAFSAQPVIRRALGDRITLAVEVRDATVNVTIDRGQAHLLLLNLALNARDAMSDGGEFRVAVTRLGPDDTRPAELPPGDYAVITASDTGSGIAPEVMPHLFEPFFTTKGDGKGSGLGLATCHGIARAAGGTITAESLPGRGATFRVYLPASGAETAPSVAASVVSERGGRETLLVVEDGAALRGLIARDLRGRGYTVLVAGSAEEALTLLSDPERIVDLALLDIGLPGLSGTDLATIIRRERPATRIVLMSGNPGTAGAHALISNGMPFLQKPFGTRLLGDLMRRVLDAGGAG